MAVTVSFPRFPMHGMPTFFASGSVYCLKYVLSPASCVCNNFSFFSDYHGGLFAMRLGVLVLIIEMCFVVEDFS